jgi:CBS domain-containing protein
VGEKTVRDLMLPLAEYAAVPAEASLREALLSLQRAQAGVEGRHRHRAVLVMDANGRVIGKVTHWSFLKSLEPKLLQEGDIAALHRAGLSPEFIQGMVRGLPEPVDSLAGLCRMAARIRAKDAMVPVRESIEEGAPLTEAIRYLVLTHAQSTLVTRDGEVVGILRLTDVFDEMAGRVRECRE